jgi:hypothetical protein
MRERETEKSLRCFLILYCTKLCLVTPYWGGLAQSFLAGHEANKQHYPKAGWPSAMPNGTNPKFPPWFEREVGVVMPNVFVVGAARRHHWLLLSVDLTMPLFFSHSFSFFKHSFHFFLRRLQWKRSTAERSSFSSDTQTERKNPSFEKTDVEIMRVIRTKGTHGCTTVVVPDILLLLSVVDLTFQSLVWTRKGLIVADYLSRSKTRLKWLSMKLIWLCRHEDRSGRVWSSSQTRWAGHDMVRSSWPDVARWLAQLA